MSWLSPAAGAPLRRELGFAAGLSVSLRGGCLWEHRGAGRREAEGGRRDRTGALKGNLLGPGAQACWDPGHVEGPEFHHAPENTALSPDSQRPHHRAGGAASEA